MKKTMEVHYEGDLRTRAQHLRSGNVLITDAPLDNQGKGEAFSPTDLLCTSLVSCQMTIMGIVAKREDWNIEGIQASIVKVMGDNPRHVAEIHISYHGLAELNLPPKAAKVLKHAADTCPVAQSLSPAMRIVTEMNF